MRALGRDRRRQVGTTRLAFPEQLAEIKFVARI
jgi:hypothetical protein